MQTNSAFRAAAIATTVVMTTLAPLDRADAQVSIKRSPSGFNLFSVQQDVEVGRQSAAEVERQLPILNDSRTNSFLGGIVARLSAQAPGAKYPYSIKAVNANHGGASVTGPWRKALMSAFVTPGSSRPRATIIAGVATSTTTGPAGTSVGVTAQPAPELGTGAAPPRRFRKPCVPTRAPGRLPRPRGEGRSV